MSLGGLYSEGSLGLWQCESPGGTADAVASRGEGIELSGSPKSYTSSPFVPAYQANSNNNQRVIYADKSLEKFQNFKSSFQ